MTLETAERMETQPEKEQQAVPDQIEFEKDYGNPVDLFDKHRDQIDAIINNKEHIKEIAVRRRELLNELINDYFANYVKDNQPVFLNCTIHQKECIVTFFRALVKKILLNKKEISRLKMDEVDTLFGEAFNNLVKHEKESAYALTDKIPFKLLITPQKLQFLLGNSNISSSGKVDISQIPEIDWSDPDQLAKAESGGMGLLMTKDPRWAESAEVRKKRIQFTNQEVRDEYAYLVTIDLLKQLPVE